MENFKPLEDRCLVKLEKPPTMAGLIHIPESVRVKGVRWGEVLKVGDGFLTDKGIKVPMYLKAGDRVALGLYADQPLGTQFGDDLVVVRQQSILGVEDEQ